MIFLKKISNTYHTLKKLVPDAILFMQVGAFMRVMDDDARAASGVTGLKPQAAREVDNLSIIGDFPKNGLG